MNYKYFILLLILFVCACREKTPEKSVVIPLKVFSDSVYQDNPEIGFRSKNYHEKLYNALHLTRNTDTVFDLKFTDSSDSKHFITLKHVDLGVLIPSVSEWIKPDPYLTTIEIASQEWNHQQISFLKGKAEIELSGESFEKKDFRKIDLIQNSLGAGLWEVIVYEKKDNQELPYFHGWFELPSAIYRYLFEQKNKLSYKDYKVFLENGKKPAQEKIDLSLLRQELDTKPINFLSLNEYFYPLKGEFPGKMKNVVYPLKPSIIQEFLNDTTAFASFGSVGLYDKTRPHATELGRMANLENILQKKIIVPESSQDTLTEFEFQFSDVNDNRKIRMFLGGINLKKIPRLTFEEIENAWQMPFGIGNHPFRESYQESLNYSGSKSPYYGILTDEHKNWLDNKPVGIDGSLLFVEKGFPHKLHFLLLSYERHAIVGHYLMQI